MTKTGEVTDVKLLKGLGYGIDEEAIRVVLNMPRWIPAKQGGKVVNVRFNLPINFELEEGFLAAKNKADFRKDYTSFVINGKKVSYDDFIKAEQEVKAGKYGVEGWTDPKTKTAYMNLTRLAPPPPPPPVEKSAFFSVPTNDASIEKSFEHFVVDGKEVGFATFKKYSKADIAEASTNSETISISVK